MTCLRLKSQGGGKIINIGSMFSLFGSDWVAPNSASQGGVVQVTKSLATAWARDVSRSTLSCPAGLWLT